MIAPGFTPGPWHLSDDGRIVLSNQSHPVATLSDPSHRQVMDRSGRVYAGNDGPLIAAAPALYKACEAALVELECCSQRAGLDEDEPMPHGEWCSQCLAHEKVAAALRAARGEP